MTPEFTLPDQPGPPTIVSLFDGIAGFPLAFGRAGVRTVATVEIDKQAAGVAADHYPDAGHFDDIREVTGADLLAAGFDPRTGRITAGFPCFVAGTRILTERGWLPIEDVRVGDSVLSHTGTWRPVTSIMAKVADHTVTVRGHGIPDIVTTEEHPFYARTRRSVWVGRQHGKWRTEMSAPEWIDAAKMAGQFAGQVLPPIEPDSNPADLWWLAGRYLADGWTTTGKPGKHGRVVICCAHDEADELAERIGRVVHATRSETLTTTNFIITQKWFVEFVAPYGKGAGGKTLTRRELTLPADKAEALLAGWLTGDGWHDDGQRADRGTTVSRSLALSLALLVQRARGLVAAVYEQQVPARKVIAGREVGQRTQYQIVIPGRNRSAVVDGDYGWKKVRSAVRSDRPVLVYNLSVGVDESYIADGAIVHNCQDLSLAGRRAGLDGARSGLFFEIMRLIDEIQQLTGVRPRWVILENVPGLLSSVCPCPGDGTCGGGLGKRVPRGGRRPTYDCTTPHPVPGGACGRRRRGDRGRCVEIHGGAMGAVLGELAERGYGYAYRVLDAQHFGVPQRRRRVVIVANSSDWDAPAQVLLEPESGSGDSPAGRAQRARLARVLGRSLALAGGGGGTAPTLQGGGRRGYRVDAETAAGGGLVPETADTLVARNAKGSPTSSGDGFTLIGVAGSLTTAQGGPDENRAAVGHIIPFNEVQVTHPENRSRPEPGDPSPTLDASGRIDVAYALRADPGGTGQGHNTNYVVGDEPETYQGQGGNVGPMGTLRAGEGTVQSGVPFTAIGGGIAHTLAAEGPDSSEDGTGRGTPIVAASVTAKWAKGSGGPAGDEVQNLAPIAFGRTNGLDEQASEDATPTLRSGSGGAAVMATAAVRRLTPVECERLQGYPSVITWGDDLTKDEHIVAALTMGHIVVDAETGVVRRTRGPGGITLRHPEPIGGTLSSGYRVATLHVGQMRRQVRLNRVVWIEVNGIPGEGLVVCHRDNDKTNNAIGNLYLATGQQNSTDAAADGLYLSGDDNPSTKLPVAQRRTLCEVYANGASIRAAAERFGISKSRAHQIIREEDWTATSGGRPQADSSRYRQLGNSIAVPVFEWVAIGIQEYDEAKESASR